MSSCKLTWQKKKKSLESSFSLNPQAGPVYFFHRPHLKTGDTRPSVCSHLSDRMFLHEWAEQGEKDKEIMSTMQEHW